MTFLAIVILGVLAIRNIPVSLIPDVNIPVITVRVGQNNFSARQLENSVVKHLRRQLSQLTHLSTIESETRDEHASIKLNFAYGADIDLAFIEANEKIDRTMASFPRDILRPQVIKASAADIPVFYLNLSLNESQFLLDKTKNERQERSYAVSQEFVSLSNFTAEVIVKRLEQLPAVGMVDMSGLVHPELLIMPDLKKLEALQITTSEVESTIKNNNLSLGSLIIRNGQYMYNVRFSSKLLSKTDIENIYISAGSRLLQLKDIAEVVEQTQKRKGLVISDGRDALTLAIIKQSDARMGDLKDQLHTLVNRFERDYPEITFTVTRDQTSLLDYAISNLYQDLIWGALIALLIMSVFLRDLRSPLLIGLTMPASVIVSLILFYLLDISINIISLSGLVLGVGMMIDNSIIVIDNISQYRNRGLGPIDACVKGASEVFFPMMSSVLTTCAVFIPLIFTSGISGALFYDEAMAVAIGSFVSLLLSVTIIPVYYKILYLKNTPLLRIRSAIPFHFSDIERAYKKIFKFILRHQTLSWLAILFFSAAGVYVYSDLPKSRLPPLTKDEVIIKIDWNERLNIDENKKRVQNAMTTVGERLQHFTGLIGEQQFLLNSEGAMEGAEAFIYCKSKSPDYLHNIKTDLKSTFEKTYPQAIVTFEDAENIFNVIFASKEAPLIAKLKISGETDPKQNARIKNILDTLKKNLPRIRLNNIPWQEHTVLSADPEKMAIYGISWDELYTSVQSAFNDRQIFVMNNNQNFVPVMLGSKPIMMNEILQQAHVQGKSDEFYPLQQLITTTRDMSLKSIVADREGEYIPMEFEVTQNESGEIMKTIKTTLMTRFGGDVDFGGSIFSNQKLIAELSVIFAVSLLLLYFILAAQFESVTLPFIVLAEIPVDVAGAFIFLKLFGSGINLMSLIGIVVMSGIIINDSILKIDIMNKLRKEGHSLLRAMLEGGERRFKSILMTSLTTVFAMIPLLFTPGLGAELQKPLAIALGGSMIVGTVVSLYFIPLCYYYLKR